jgi:hypothetical protein
MWFNQMFKKGDNMSVTKYPETNNVKVYTMKY